MINRPTLEIVLRKYEPPTDNLQENVRKFLLSLGLMRPGEKNPLIEGIFIALLEEKEGLSVREIANRFSCSESAVRYHLQRLKELRLVEGRKIYRIAEGDLEIAFRLFKKYIVEEILERIEEYVKKIT